MKIAIDGPSGTGKSTIAKVLAKELDLVYVDTGAMYRSVGLFLLKNNVDLLNEKMVEEILPKIDLDVIFEDGKQIMMLDNEDVTLRIRQQDCADASSKCAIYKCVRVKLVEMQKEIGKKYNVVMDGRDIGSNVLKNADYKFYLDASAKIRGQRRVNELDKNGIKADLNKIIEEIEERDYRDKNRKISPLIKTDDAIYIDTSHMSIDEVKENILLNIKERKN